MTKDIQETLEGLKKELKKLNEKYQRIGDYKKSIPLEVVYLIKALSTAIGWGEVLEESKKVLPDEIKRLIPTHPNFSLEIDNLQIAHNELINLIRPILAKALLRIEEETKARIKYQDIVYKICLLFDTRQEKTTIDEVVDKVKELQSAKEENKKLRDTKCPGCGHFISIVKY